jgi:hypothetical protein
VELLCQTTDNCLGRDYLAVDHLKPLYRVHAQLSTELEYIRTPRHAKVSDEGAEPVWFWRHGHGGSKGYVHDGRNCAYCSGVFDLEDGDDAGLIAPDGASIFGVELVESIQSAISAGSNFRLPLRRK